MGLDQREVYYDHDLRTIKEFIGVTPKQYQRIFTGTAISHIKETTHEH